MSGVLNVLACGWMGKSRSQETKPGAPTSTAANHRGCLVSANQKLIRAVLISILLLVPCFWQSRIQSQDLSSHTYNAWLASLVAQGKAPGLRIVRQRENVLFDLVLEWLLVRVGPAAAQRIAVSAAVLIFAWGAIAFATRAVGRSSPVIVPCIAMLAYGFVFHIGFFNLYLSTGFCFWFLAEFWKSDWHRRLLAAPLLLIAWMAHPLPVAWTLGVAAYIAIAEELTPESRAGLLVLGILAVTAGRFFLISHYVCKWSWTQVIFITGANQLILFGNKYALASVGLLLLWLMRFRNLIKTEGWRLLLNNILFQLLILNAVGIALLPNDILLPRYGRPTLSLIPDRMSLLVAVLVCALVASANDIKYEKFALAVLIAYFFGILYRDTLQLNRVETAVSTAVDRLPEGQRVVACFSPSTHISPLAHTLDRACIGHCFSYGNYEPSARRFRVRVSSGNTIVMSDYHDVALLEDCEYAVQPRDPPLVEIFWCQPNGPEVCARDAGLGDVVGRNHIIVDHRPRTLGQVILR